MSTTTRFVAQVVVQRITTTTHGQSELGFGSSSSSKSTEKVTTVLTSGVEEKDLIGVIAKVEYSLKLAYPTIKSPKTTEETSSASASS
jgi:hypothetical protein